MARILLAEGDITASEVDAIINAANTDLMLGSGVAGAIRELGGPEIQAECDRLGPIALGGAVQTCSGNLPAASVIHAAGMELGGAVTEESLRATTHAALEVAAGAGMRSIAFPAIGTGVGGFPVQRCAEIMLEVVQAFCAADSSLEEVHFVLYGEPDYRIFEQVHDAAKIRAQMEKLGR